MQGKVCGFELVVKIKKIHRLKKCKKTPLLNKIVHWGFVGFIVLLKKIYRYYMEMDKACPFV